MGSLTTNPAFLNGRSQRQAVGSIFLALTQADCERLGTTKTCNIDFEAPQGSMLIDGSVVVDTASDDSGTDVLHVGDPASADRYHAAVNLKAAAQTNLTRTGYPTDGSSPAFRLTRNAQNGDGTGVLAFRVFLEYITLDKSDWTEGAF
jgi:hypothetical protein